MEVASAAAVGPPPGMRVRLSSNESPFGPSPQALAAMREAVADAHRYPDDQSSDLRARIADVEGVGVGEVAVGNGSAAVLMDLIAHESRRQDATGPGRGTVLSYGRAFVVYRLGAQVAGMDYVEAPLGASFERDPQALLDLVDDATRVVALDNPGNPTGRHLDADGLGAVVDNLPEHVTVVVDEAYHHFATGQDGYATVAELGLDHPRLLVVRTFSKAHALAGLRLGYVTGPADLVGVLDTERERFNANAVAQAAAVASLADADHLDATVRGTLDGRRRMAAGLRELEVPFVDGLGNFLLVDLGEPAEPVTAAYADLGVGVRTLGPYRLDQHVRVTVGTPGEVDAFLDASREVLAGVASRGRS